MKETNDRIILYMVTKNHKCSPKQTKTLFEQVKDTSDRCRSKIIPVKIPHCIAVKLLSHCDSLSSHIPKFIHKWVKQ